MERVRLRNGFKLPVIGLGTYKLKGEVCIYAVRTAMELGCRAVDTAAVYKNEEMVWRGIVESGVPREEICVTSKLQPKDQGGEKAALAFEKTVTSLGGVPPDVYLIHWPGAAGEKPESEGNRRKRRESWRVLEGLYKDGRVKAIGVSNYTIEHLKDLISDCEIVPFINQVELHILLQQRELMAYCKSLDIHVTSYSTLGCGNLVRLKPVIEVANKYNVSASSLLLSWAISMGVSVIPEASSESHLRNNHCSISHLLPSEAYSLLEESCSGLEEARYCWDPTKIR